MIFDITCILPASPPSTVLRIPQKNLQTSGSYFSTGKPLSSLCPGYIRHPEILPLQGRFSAPGENSGCEVKPVRRFRRNLLLRKESLAFHCFESPPAAMVRWGLFFLCATFFFSGRVTFRVTGKGTDSPFSPYSLCPFSTQNYRQ